MLAYVEQFHDAIQAAGLNPPEQIKDDGNLHRFASNGKRGDDAGWYSLHGDGIPAGSFGCWRAGILEAWRADIGRNLTREEDAAHQQRVKAMRREALSRRNQTPCRRQNQGYGDLEQGRTSTGRSSVFGEKGNPATQPTDG